MMTEGSQDNNTIIDEIGNYIITMGVFKEREILETNKEIKMRISWKIGSLCSIYSRSKDIWYQAQIVNIYTDETTNEEWIRVKYNKKQIKSMQRFSEFIKPPHLEYESIHKSLIIQIITNALRAKVIDDDRFVENLHLNINENKEKKAHNKIHDWDTVDDYVLLEGIRDILSDIAPQIQQIDDDISDKIKKYVYYCFNAPTNTHIQRRIDCIMSEIRKQDTEKGINDSANDNKGSTNDNKDLSALQIYEQTPLVYKQNEQMLTNTESYKNINHNYTNEMRKLLKQKTKTDLWTECCLDICSAETDDILDKCESIKRINLILWTYHQLMNTKELWRNVRLAPILVIDDTYGHQQILNDFLHIKFTHIDATDTQLIAQHEEKDTDKNVARKVCQHFENAYKCEDIAKCYAFHRHYRDRTDLKREKQMFHIFKPNVAIKSAKQQEMMNDKDWIFQEECDKIHCYFIHSLMQFPDDDDAANKRIDDINTVGLGRSWSKAAQKAIKDNPKTAYIGQKEDQNWLNKFSADEKMSDEDGYKLLIEHMGVFRWQSAHGFRTGQNRGLMHLQPKFQNIKEEALYNHYCQATKDNWNQTLRKSKLFFQSFARQRLRALYDGSFKDEISDQYRHWKKGDITSLQDIVTLKLYTDFDQLQHELKKCFRWETIVVLLNKFDAVSSTKEEEKYDDEKKLKDLENRLREFFYWRINLLTVLNKFGTKINEQKELYHGVNAKMILNPAETMAFYGPLSTTSSYHVAKTFATAKGMVLKITSHFPRLNYCWAFDASLISDYPEEQEYLISFVYLRVLEVRTRPIVRDPTKGELWNKAPFPSKIRAVFFAVHLFREQIFSMSSHLEYYLIQFLKCNRMDCCQNHQTELPQEMTYRKSFLSWLCCHIAQHPKALTKSDDPKRHWKGNTMDDPKGKQIMRILWTKFKFFRNTPNLKQIIKIDEISDGLKEFFLEKAKNGDVHGNDKYLVSFKNLLEVFPNIEEVHYINNYRFDNDILRKLLHLLKEEKKKREQNDKERKGYKLKSICAIAISKSNSQIAFNHDEIQEDEKHNQPTLKLSNLKKIAFLYYNYTDHKDSNTGKSSRFPIDGDKFFDPKGLNGDLINELKNTYNWVIKYGENGKIGFKIRVYENVDQDYVKQFAEFGSLN